MKTRDEIFKEAKRIQGYGQDFHSDEGTPETYVVEDKDGVIHVFVDNENAHYVYEDSSFEEELQNHEDSGYGKGFKVL